MGVIVAGHRLACAVCAMPLRRGGGFSRFIVAVS